MRIFTGREKIKIKVITLVGTRPELIKLSRVIPLLDKYTDHTLVHSGQNHDYELNQIFFEDLNIRKPNYFLECAKRNPFKNNWKFTYKY